MLLHCLWLNMCCSSILAISLANGSFGSAVNLQPLANWSIMTMITVSRWDTGKLVMKSKEIWPRWYGQGMEQACQFHFGFLVLIEDVESCYIAL